MVDKRKLKNPNHPPKGSRLDIQPLRKQQDIKTLLKYLDGHPRNYLLFVLGINTGIRVTDILPLRVGDLKYLKVGEALQITESKTGKKNVIIINKSIRNAIDKFIKIKQPDDNTFFFQSDKKDEKGNRQPISIHRVHAMIKQWTKAINLDHKKYGARTLRKTWGYQQRIKYGVGFEVIAKRYNHSSPAITMRYLGIEDKEVRNVLMNEIC